MNSLQTRTNKTIFAWSGGKDSATARMVSVWRSRDIGLSKDTLAPYFITAEAEKLAKEYEQKIYPNIVRHPRN